MLRSTAHLPLKGMALNSQHHVSPIVPTHNEGIVYLHVGRSRCQDWARARPERVRSAQFIKVLVWDFAPMKIYFWRNSLSGTKDYKTWKSW